MEDRGRKIAPRRQRAPAVRCALAAAAAVWLVGAVPPASGKSLDRAIPGLFGGVLITTIDPGAQQDLQEVRVAERFRGLSAALAAARSQAPIPSASGAFRFAWDPDLDTFVRDRQSLGSSLAERALTLGRGTITLGTSYSRIDFDTLEGDDLDHLRASQPALTPGFLAQLPASDQAVFSDDVLATELDLSFQYDLFFVTAAYGVTDTIDISMALSVNRAQMRARASASILDPDGDGAAVFGSDQRGVQTDGTACVPFSCARDGFDVSAFGTGDIFLRGKWHFYDFAWADLATAAVLTIPTGNADDLLGFHDPTFTPWLIASRSFGRLAPHLNLGYHVREPEPPRAPPDVTEPESTMMMFEPRLLICSSTRACAPLPTAIMTITAATPMMMPSMVKAERILLMRRASRATRRVAAKFIVNVMWPARPPHRWACWPCLPPPRHRGS